ncbi:SPASM domain-containing protein, partial [Ensifer aridi]|uniref:SPASM domain-containing protein n=1 Tax=Ensifer aridi TaxID=1708715 RepID=UPI00111BE10B
EQYSHLCNIEPPEDADKLWTETDWYPCGGMISGMSIFPSGDVSVCDKMHGVKAFTLGNVFDAGLKEIWNSDAFALLCERATDPEVVDSDCAICSKLRLCRTSCFVDSFNVTGSYFGKDPSCGGPFLN